MKSKAKPQSFWFELLSLEAGIGYSIDRFTYAEAVQLFCEKGRIDWGHTALLAYYTCEVNRDPKKGKKVVPADYNPWESSTNKVSEPLTQDNFHLLSKLATSWRGQ